jgi:hypothetical protein
VVFGKEKIIEKKLQQECHKSDLIAMEKVFFGLLVRATVVTLCYVKSPRTGSINLTRLPVQDQTKPLLPLIPPKKAT